MRRGDEGKGGDMRGEEGRGEEKGGEGSQIYQE